jgi:4-alpha-glucanotransferase
MHEQLASTSATLAAAGVSLAMDLPIGCSAAGFDPWAFPDVYANGASIGAPPDTFFASGQDWGFPPPRPDADRRNGYPVLRACLAHSLRHASILRVDHVLGWSRLWWIPEGMPATHGAYVRYPFEELLAVASLEAWRQSARLLGEDLGTVERGLRAKLAKHDIAGMSVAVFELSDAPLRRLRPRAGSAAYVDTHDTATFASWFDGSDITLRASLGMLTPEQERREREGRTRAREVLLRRLARNGTHRTGGNVEEDRVESLEVLGAVLAELGSSEAYIVLVAIEDLWGELDPQNVPGTTDEHDNFSRRIAHRVEQIAEDERACAILGVLDASRRAAPWRPR